MNESPRHRMLVSGGAGFLGTNLCQRLLAEGHQVVCLDDFSTGLERNIAHLRDQPGFKLLHHDITQPRDVQAERVFNLACPASPPHYQADPVRTTLTCLQGSLNMLEVARRHGARIFQASTSEVYGDPQVHPQREDYRGNVNPTGPRACYDEGKRCAESLFLDYHRQYRVAVRVGRIFNTYGPYMRPDDGRVISNFIVQALQNQPITLHGDGSQTRSFCYVDDLIDGILALMDSPEDLPGPVNLGNPVEITVLELAERIIAITGSRSNLIRRPLPQDDPLRRCPDIALARQALGWEPRIPMEEGLVRTIGYFEQRLNQPDFLPALGVVN
ncbi:MAG: UDP-glucuronic acid decarboxylase family protein [Candidatus Competibacteraceae bacterium]|nr:UDP-glucuronic acid decarboxylase family protein [Candidatus Competibacteraceae bacterium]